MERIYKAGTLWQQFRPQGRGRGHRSAMSLPSGGTVWMRPHCRPALYHRQNGVAKLMLPGMAFEFKAVRRVEFSETDMAGIVHFANFFRYMETAEHGFFRELGYSVVMEQFDPPLGWPRVHAECDYRQPLRFEDEVEIHLLVSEKKSKSLSYIFKFNKLTGAGPSRQREEVARGSLTVVCVAKQSDGKMAAVHIPKPFADKIDVAPAEML